MKKILLPVLSLTLAACSSSQVTVTRYAQMTVTSSPPTATPIPTPTLHPQFIALQEKIAASGERFTLTSDGTIQGGAKTVPGLFVDKTGAITLRGLSSQVTLDPADVSFDDEKGVSVEGYTLDEATGLWEPAQETIDIGGNLSVILGEKVDGGTLIDSFVADPSLTPEQQVEKLDKVDYTVELGIPKEDAVWMQNEKGETVLVWESDHSSIIGWWMRSRVTARTEMVWNAPELIDHETGESVFFKPGVARIWNTDTVYTTELDTMRKTIAKIFNGEAKDWRLDREIATTSYTVRITSIDGKEVVFGLFVVPQNDIGSGDGVLFFEGEVVDSNGNREVKEIILSDFAFIRG